MVGNWVLALTKCSVSWCFLQDYIPSHSSEKMKMLGFCASRLTLQDLQPGSDLERSMSSLICFRAFYIWSALICAKTTSFIYKICRLDLMNKSFSSQGLRSRASGSRQKTRQDDKQNHNHLNPPTQPSLQLQSDTHRLIQRLDDTCRQRQSLQNVQTSKFKLLLKQHQHNQEQLRQNRESLSKIEEEGMLKLMKVNSLYQSLNGVLLVWKDLKWVLSELSAVIVSLQKQGRQVYFDQKFKLDRLLNISKQFRSLVSRIGGMEILVPPSAVKAVPAQPKESALKGRNQQLEREIVQLKQKVQKMKDSQLVHMIVQESLLLLEKGIPIAHEQHQGCEQLTCCKAVLHQQIKALQLRKSQLQQDNGKLEQYMKEMSYQFCKAQEECSLQPRQQLQAETMLMVQARTIQCLLGQKGNKGWL